MDMEWAKGIDVNHGKIPTYYQLTDIEFQDLDEDLGEDSWITIDPNTNQPIKNAYAKFLVFSWKREKENRKRRHSGIFFGIFNCDKCIRNGRKICLKCYSTFSLN